MLVILLNAFVLVAITVTAHATGLTWLVRLLQRRRHRLATGGWPATWTLILMAWGLIMLHLVEISVWALFFLWRGCLPDAETAFYFAGVTYTSIGYGDLVLAEPWRLLAPIEGLAGILMCGLSASFFFAVVSQIYQAKYRDPQRAPG